MVPHFAVSIITCARNQSLLRLVANLSRQIILPEPNEAFTFSIEVIDNSKSHPLNEDEVQVLQRSGVNYTYLGAENIAVARNFAVRQCTADFLAFIDDDELASFDWLAQLRRAAEQGGADVVFGPNIPWFPQGAPSWLTDTELLAPSYPPTGEDGFTWSTANCAIRMASLRSGGTTRLRFNDQLGECGGSDTDFFQQLYSLGFRFTWTRSAVTYEAYESNRVTLGWVIRRAYRCGGVNTAISRKWSVDRYTARLFEVGLAPIRFLRVLLALRYGREFLSHAVLPLRQFVFSLGIITYLITGRVWCEYHKKGLVRLELGGSRPRFGGILCEVMKQLIRGPRSA